MMRKFLKPFVVGVAALGLLGTAAQAAIVNASGDNVQVNTGSGFKTAPPVSNVKPGSVVSVGAGGSAIIQYENGCSFSVRPGQVVTIPERAPTCNGAAVPPASHGYVLPVLIGAGAIGGGIAIATKGGGSKRPVSP